MNQPTGEGKPPLDVLCLFVCFGDHPKNFPKISVTPQSSQTQTILRHLSRANSHLWHSRPKRFSLSQTNSRRLHWRRFSVLILFSSSPAMNRGTESRFLSSQQNIFQWAVQTVFQTAHFFLFLGGTKRGIKNTSGQIFSTTLTPVPITPDYCR